MGESIAKALARGGFVDITTIGRNSGAILTGSWGTSPEATPADLDR